MPSKIEETLGKFQSNVYPAMYEDLGRHLGVTAKSLSRLALGFAPIVEFRRGKNFQGWWAIPERNAEGAVIGISLRSQADMKVMFPSSKHGLIYEVNPKSTWGGTGYTPGPDNWVRTADAGVLCPICGKPDGCLVSSGCPADPVAVGCIREQSPRRIDDGGLPTWLHILKSEGSLSFEPPLSCNGGPTIVVEGMSDCAAAMDLGFDAVGRPSNLSCMDLLKKLLWNRDHVIVVGENDRKANGREPGKEGMIATFQTLRRSCKKVTMLMPPSDVKDLRVWLTRGLTHEGFIQYHSQHAEEFAEETTIDDDRPLTMAKAYLASEYKVGHFYTLRRWAETWYQYNGLKYARLDGEAFRQPIYHWAHDKIVRCIDYKNGGETLKPIKANTSFVANLEAAVAAETLVHDSSVPCWINDVKGPDPRNMVVFANGILDVNRYLNSEADDLLEPTPDLFTTTAVPYPFDPTATCPTWLRFLQSSLGDEPSKIALLQEWFGYCMTPDTTKQKLMFLRGVSGAGKGVIIDTLCTLVGTDQVAATSFSDLAGGFGLHPLMDKLICVIADARTPRFGDTVRGLELLLNIASGDVIQINRKFKDILEQRRLTARITIASNEFLDVPDHAGAMLRRMNIVEFKRSFKENPDDTLRVRIDSEIHGVAIWALEGLRRLRTNGSFTVPESSKEAGREWRVQSSPIAEFLDQCTDPDGSTPRMELFEAYEKWSRERNSIKPISMSRFAERLRSTAPYIGSDVFENGSVEKVFTGVSLQAWAARRYLGRMV